MTTEVKVPMLPESVADATVLTWYKKPGDTVKRDENLVDLETDKVVLEVPAPKDGILSEVLKNEGETVVADEVLAIIGEGSSKSAPESGSAAKETKSAKQPEKKEESHDKESHDENALSPAVRRLVAEKSVDIKEVSGSGKGGRVTKEDVLHFLSKKTEPKAPPPQPKEPMMASLDGRGEKRVPMSRLRARIAERLLESKNSTAMLTTFNEIDLKAVMDLRNRHKDQFEKSHGVKLGFMSFFTKAVVEALKRFPDVNASIDGQDIIYHDYCDIGIAVSSPRGLVVPILRNVEGMSLAHIEKAIAEYAVKARDGKLTVEEMTGGTFTISNGGVFGSLLSTPILNPPQSAILGMHKIEERPVVQNGEIVIRPMMYVAMSYDHRIIDGKESVSFLVTIKNYLEDPARLLLDI